MQNFIQTFFNSVRRSYSRFAPEPIRTSRWMARLKTIVPHDLMYDEEYFKQIVEEPSRLAAPLIAKSIVTDLQTGAVVDVGCGTGALLEALQKLGCSVMGIDNADAALAYCRSRNVPVQKFDLERDPPPAWTNYDVAVSLEVAEHLPERCANDFIRLLTKLANNVVFTAASPGQGGADHVNEQPASYWVRKFEGQGFEFDAPLSLRWREDWRNSGKVARWYWMNCMVFRNRLD